MKELLVDGDFGSDAMALPFVSWHAKKINDKKLSSQLKFETSNLDICRFKMTHLLITNL